MAILHLASRLENALRKSHRNRRERHFGRLLATNSSGHPKPATTSRQQKKFFLVEWTQIQQLLQLAHCPACRKRLMDESSPPNVHRKGSAIVVRCSCEYGNGAASLRFRE
ncbi:hypothetical protein L596_021408 [Steinernema carpocapsae]|uniref:Uncharacterized protein n=1 Tax=Steinernema carpocapsae TaxID=34508 RepID=A0A4U5MIP0_STECR|nr:hypothetical protein L596_021408 [Steinernema carpocapsae]